MFDLMIWAGAAVTLIGLALLVYCILRVARAKRSGASDEETRIVLQSVVVINLGGLCLSALGLICVIVGIALQ